MCSVQASLQSLSVSGLPELDATQPPTLASSQGETVGPAAADKSFVDVLFETNPLDGACDTRIRLSVQPLETTFHAVCIKHFLVVAVVIALNVTAMSVFWPTICRIGPDSFLARYHESSIP